MVLQTRIVMKYYRFTSIRRSTARQQAAVRFTEFWLDDRFEFKGNIESFEDCHEYLSQHLDHAKQICEDATESYYSTFD